MVFNCTAFANMIVPPRVCLHSVGMTLVGMVSGPLKKTLTLVVSSEAFLFCMTIKLGKKFALDAEWDKKRDINRNTVK